MAGPTNLQVELYHSDAWNHARSYVRNVVQATWGMRDEGSSLTPARCTATLDNRDGSYSPDDSRSPLYGLIGRNTPGRVSMLPALASGVLSDTTDAFGRTSADSWGSADSGQAWSLFGTAADFDVAGGFGTQAVTAADSSRLAYLAGIAVRDVDVAVTFKVAQATGANLEPANIAVRGTSTTSYVMARVNLTTGNVVTLQVYARDLTELGSATVTGLTHTGTGQPLRVRVLAVGARIHVKVWIAADAEPDAWQLVVIDTTEPPMVGFIGVRSGRATGNTNSPATFSYDDWSSITRLAVADGAVSSYAPDRAPGNVNNAWSGIAITGPSQRVNASKSVISALRVAIPASLGPFGSGPDAYWPLEDGEDATQAGSGLPGGTPLATSPEVSFGASLVPPGSLSAVDLTGEDASISGATNFSAAVADSWEIEFPVGYDELPTDNTKLYHLMTMGTPGPTVDWWSIWLYISGGTVRPRIFYWSLALGLVGGTATLPIEAGQTHHLRAHFAQAGANIEYTMHVDGVANATSTLNTATLTRPTRLWVAAVPEMDTAAPAGFSFPFAALAPPSSVSHIAIWTNPARSVATTYEAAAGFVGELAADRYVRLLAQHGIPGAVYGEDSQPMGPQYPDTLPNLLGDIARTDLGMIYDGRGWHGLEMRTGASLRNQAAALALTFGEGGDVHEAKPITDDLGLTNDVTAVRRRGSSAHAIQEEGPNNIQDPADDPEGIGRIESTLNVNPDDDTSLADLAEWGLHVGTWKGSRYRNVTVDLSKHPELLAAAMAIRPGDRITIDDLDADQVELLVLGGADAVPTHDLRVAFNCVPAGPYRTGIVETVGNRRIGSSTSLLAADFTTGTDTSMSVAVTGSLWSTTEPPFHIRIAGVVLNVTAISGATSPQTFTVDQAPINGIARTVSASGPESLRRIDVETPIFVAP